jgi:hypothetical protein
MRLSWYAGILAAIAWSMTAGAAPTCANPVGDWTNELSSTLSIAAVDSQTGQLSGSYSSPSGTSGQKFAIVGWLNTATPVPGKDNATIIAFTVRWGPYGTITSWTGICNVRDNLLYAQWLLGDANADFAWKHINTGLDTFMPSSSPSSRP